MCYLLGWVVDRWRLLAGAAQRTDGPVYVDGDFHPVLDAISGTVFGFTNLHERLMWPVFDLFPVPVGVLEIGDLALVVILESSYAFHYCLPIMQ